MGMGEVGLMYGLILGVAGMTDSDGRIRRASWCATGCSVVRLGSHHGAILAAPLYLLAYAQESSSAALIFSLVAALSLPTRMRPHGSGLVRNLRARPHARVGRRAHTARDECPWTGG